MCLHKAIFFPHQQHTAYTWELVSSALEAANRGAGAGAGAAGGTLQVVVIGAVHHGADQTR